ncbi:hypothetical protein CLU79DRAFT_705632 [Phycomyces nitens]|nr:hypothetical protein CLU79DRAFT_705632 [Phycomyces nitens]
MESSSVKYSEVIANAMNQLKDAGKMISIHDVVNELQNDIVQSYTPSDINSFKRIWLSRITETARLKGFTLVSRNRKPDWSGISEEILEKLVRYTESKSMEISGRIAESVSSEASSTSHSHSSPSTASATSSVKSSLSAIDKQEIAKIFSSLDRSNMWTLSTGTVVELKMEEFSKACNFDHPSHSLILDPDDTLTWDGTFTRQELDEIRSFKAPAFEIVPKTIISLPKHQSLDQMHKNVSEQYINPRSDSYNYWVKKSLIEGLDILMSNKASTIGDSEAEIVDRIWKIIPWAFDQGEIVAKRQITSEVSTSQMNERKKLSSIDKISRQKTGKRVDMIFKYDTKAVEDNWIDYQWFEHKTTGYGLPKRICMPPTKDRGGNISFKQRVVPKIDPKMSAHNLVFSFDDGENHHNDDRGR